MVLKALEIEVEKDGWQRLISEEKRGFNRIHIYKNLNFEPIIQSLRLLWKTEEEHDCLCITVYTEDQLLRSLLKKYFTPTIDLETKFIIELHEDDLIIFFFNKLKEYNSCVSQALLNLIFHDLCIVREEDLVKEAIGLVKSGDSEEAIVFAYEKNNIGYDEVLWQLALFLLKESSYKMLSPLVGTNVIVQLFKAIHTDNKHYSEAQKMLVDLCIEGRVENEEQLDIASRSLDRRDQPQDKIDQLFNLICHNKADDAFENVKVSIDFFTKQVAPLLRKINDRYDDLSKQTIMLQQQKEELVNINRDLMARNKELIKENNDIQKELNIFKMPKTSSPISRFFASFSSSDEDETPLSPKGEATKSPSSPNRRSSA